MAFRKRKEHALTKKSGNRRSNGFHFTRDQLEKMVLMLNDSIMEVDDSLNVTCLVNQVSLPIYTCDKGLSRRPFAEFWNDGSREIVSELIRKSQKNLGSVIFEFQPELESDRWYGLRILSYKATNKVKTWIFVRDITARKIEDQREEERASKAYNAARLASLGELAAGIGHEINNPLTIISAKAQQLIAITKEKTMDSNKVGEIAEVIRSTALRTAKIVRALKSLSRDSETDPMSEVKMGEIFDDTLAVCASSMRQRGIKLTVKNNVPDIAINCRAAGIAQVLGNLINNACDAVHDLEEKWVEIEIRERDGVVEVSVTDSGNGVDEAIADKIMQPFFSTKDVGKGTGLGLSISKAIAESHGGSLYLDRFSDRTRFVMLLPIHNQKGDVRKTA